MSSAFIPDGYTESAWIAECHRLHPAVKFEFRPILVSERNRIAKESEGGKDFNTVAARWMADKLVTWSLGDKPDAAQVLKLKPKLFDRMLAIMTGQEAGDPEPDNPAPQKFDGEGAAKN